MDVLMIIKDTNALREGTALRASILEQSKLVNRLFVIVENPRKDHYEIQRISESVWFIPTNSRLWWLAPYDAVRIAKRELFFQGHLQTDLIVAQDPCEAGFAGAILSKRYKKPLHLRIGENIFSPYFRSASPYNAIRALVARSVVRASARIQAASENIKASLAEIGDDVTDRTAVLPPFVDAEFFLKEPVRVDLRAKYPQFKFIILMAGPLTLARNYILAVRVLAGVLKEYAHAGLVIVGEGKMRRRIRAVAKAFGIQDRVVIEGPSDNLVSYYKTASVFLVTAPYDDWHNSIAEASACGAPIVTTRVGIAPSIIVDGESGFLCDPEKPESFALSIMKLVNDPAIRARVTINTSLYLQKSVEGGKEGYLRLIKEDWEKASEKA
ncbi:MAG: glycosyltransferase family 4 protein [Candidatus Kaiserbacteria bacterium]|nr:glycosyltransferase family 4 protein [Candidatus Kaiserbacteria bacterium]